MELNALQDLQQETEHSHDLLIQTNKDQEMRIESLLVEIDELKDGLSKTSQHSEGIEVKIVKLC